jgi:hypothetical protein
VQVKIKEFWEDVAVQFNDYDDKEKYRELALTSHADLQLFMDKTINPSTKFPSQSWETLHDMFIAVQKDYKVKYQRG